MLPSWLESTYYFCWVGKTAANSGCTPRRWWNDTNKIWIGSRFGSTNRLIFHHTKIFLITNKMHSLFFRKSLFCHSWLTLESLTYLSNLNVHPGWITGYPQSLIFLTSNSTVRMLQEFDYRNKSKSLPSLQLTYSRLINVGYIKTIS